MCGTFGVRTQATPNGTNAYRHFRYEYGRDEVAEWAPKIWRMAEQADDVHAIFRNKWEDYPVRNALEMKEMLGLG